MFRNEFLLIPYDGFILFSDNITVFMPTTRMDKQYDDVSLCLGEAFDI